MSPPAGLSATDFNVAVRGVWFSVEGVWLCSSPSTSEPLDCPQSAGGAWSLPPEATPSFLFWRRWSPERVSEFFSKERGTRPKSPSNLFFVTCRGHRSEVMGQRWNWESSDLQGFGGALARLEDEDIVCLLGGLGRPKYGGSGQLRALVLLRHTH